MGSDLLRCGAQVVPSACLGQQNANGQKMTFWQENYTFIKDVYDMRHTKMAEWMENVEKAIARIMADKVYTPAEFKRERDNFHVSRKFKILVPAISFKSKAKYKCSSQI